MAYTDLNRLLSFAAPESFERMKSQHPGDSGFFSVFRKMGDKADAEQGPASPQLKLDLLSTGGETILRQIDALIVVARKKMRLSFYIRYAGTFTAIAANVAVAYLATQGKPKEDITFATALVAALSSLTASFSDIVVKSPSGISLASPDEYAKLISARLEVERTRQTLARHTLEARPAADLDVLLDVLDGLSREVLRYSLI